MLKDILWDFDGTLFDSYPVSAANFAECIYKKYGIKEDETEIISQMKKSFGDAMTFYMEKYGFDEAFCHDFYEMNDERTPFMAKPLPGVVETLKYITENGGRNFLYTHRNILTLNILKENGVIGYFTDFVTSQDGFERKPAPDAVLHILNKHGIEKSESAMVGDREIDVLAGKNAGISAFLIEDDMNRGKPTVADGVLKRISDLKKYLF